MTNMEQSNIPNMYASRGQLPTRHNFDISNCNQNWCDSVKTIKADVESGNVETWFIGIFIEAYTETTFETVDGSEDNFGARQKNATYGIWFNSTCVPGCEFNGRGTCLDSGTCDCFVDYTGIDCGICT